ncbi:Inner membrane protein YbbJ [compost metagenome]
MELWAIWLIIAGVLLVVEMLTFTFYLLWLGIGALVAGVVAWIVPDSLILQLLAGSIAALILTIFTKKITKRFRSSKGFTDIIDELVGKQGIVLEEIGLGVNGAVKVGNETWTAASNEHLQKGELVVVVAKSSTILEVHRWGGMP